MRINTYFTTAEETTPRVTIERVKAEIKGEHLYPKVLQFVGPCGGAVD